MKIIAAFVAGLFLCFFAPIGAFGAGTNGSVIQIKVCTFQPGDVRQTDYKFLAYVTFVNESNQDVSAVKFRFSLLDVFNQILNTQYGTISGQFGPGIVIQPRTFADPTLFDFKHKVYYAQNGPKAMQNPTSPAWYFESTFSRDLKGIGCDVQSVRFANGDVWELGDPDASASLVTKVSPPLPASMPTPSPSAVTEVSPSTLQPDRLQLDDHLWRRSGSKENPLIANHPKFCTVSEKAALWSNELCNYARIIWGQYARTNVKGPQSAPEPVNKILPQSSPHLQDPQAAGSGSVRGLVTWKGTSAVSLPDEEAKILLIPSPLKRKISGPDAILLRTSLSTGIQDNSLFLKYGIISGECDAKGTFTSANVPKGLYELLIVSRRTTRDSRQPLPLFETESLKKNFEDARDADNFIGNIPDQPTLLLLNNWSTMYLTVLEDRQALFNYRFDASKL